MPPHHDIHCLKCKAKTGNLELTPHYTKKGGGMVKARCASCGRNKSMFVKKGGGFFSDLFSGRLFTHPGDSLDNLSNGAIQNAQEALPSLAAAAPLAAGAGIKRKRKMTYSQRL